VIVDDCESDEQVESDEQREKLKRWFYATLLPSLKKGGKIAVIGTILHEDSLLSDLLSSWPSRRYGATEDGTLEGKPIWPAAWTTEALKETYEDYKKRGFQDLFWKEYFNRIVSPDESVFRQEYFRYVEDKELLDRADRGENFKTFITLDPAIQVGAGRDYSAFSVVYVDRENNIYVKEIKKGRWPIPETILNLFRLQKEYSPDGVGIQTIDWDRMLKVPIMTEMNRTGQRFRVTPLKTYSSLNKGLSSKKNRIMRLAPRYHAGQIFHIKGAPGIHFLEDELKGFPSTRHDDVSDALAMQLDLIFPANTKRERTDTEAEKVSNSISGY
jgi:predicted phage terminase large subunit-like protein